MAKQPVTGGIESTKLKSYIERVERLEEEKAGLASDIRDILAEAKSNGFDTKTMRQVIKLRKMKSDSALALAQLLAEGGADTFDLAYIDASHQAPDVLADAILAFKLTRIGGVIVFDDYLWRMAGPGGNDALNQPKAGIDAFVNTYFKKLSVVTRPPLRQLYVAKTSN